jgi:hypothetical protein
MVNKTEIVEYTKISRVVIFYLWLLISDNNIH